MIKASITPRMAQDRGGILCLPLVRNLGDPAAVIARRPDWRIVKCPICGAECYEGNRHRHTLAEDSSIRALCTECAARAVMGVQHG